MGRSDERRSQRAGVSLSTVSFVLNKKRGKSISPETSKRVWRWRKELNYRVNVMLVVWLAGRVIRRVWIISEIANPFFPEVIRVLKPLRPTADWSFCLCNTKSADRMEAAVNRMLARVRGVAIMTSTLA